MHIRLDSRQIGQEIAAHGLKRTDLYRVVQKIMESSNFTLLNLDPSFDKYQFIKYLQQKYKNILYIIPTSFLVKIESFFPKFLYEDGIVITDQHRLPHTKGLVIIDHAYRLEDIFKLQNYFMQLPKALLLNYQINYSDFLQLDQLLRVDMSSNFASSLFWKDFWKLFFIKIFYLKKHVKLVVDYLLVDRLWKILHEHDIKFVLTKLLVYYQFEIVGSSPLQLFIAHLVDKEMILDQFNIDLRMYQESVQRVTPFTEKVLISSFCFFTNLDKLLCEIRGNSYLQDSLS